MIHMTTTAFICDESYFWHNSGGGGLFEQGGYIEERGSAETPESKRRVKNLLEKSGLMEQLVQIKPQPATDAQLRYYHTDRHIEAVRRMSLTGGEDCGDSAIVGRGSFEIAKLSAGGAIAAVNAVVTRDDIRTAYALTRPPGHHAEADRGMGYCLFNNIVIAAKYAQKELGLRRIAIVDWDAHHGNGTEDAFYEDDSVLFVSLHQEGLDPIGRGAATDIGRCAGKGYNINIPLYAGSGDAVYKYAFEQIVLPAVERFAPELILVSAGQDANPYDPLARMMVSAGCYRHMATALKQLADKLCGGRLVCLHEGGYCPVYVPFCTHAIVEAISGITTDVGDPFVYSMDGTSINTLLPHQKLRVDEIAAAL